MKPPRDPKPGGVKNTHDAIEKRRLETATATLHRRDATVTRKRLRRDSSGASLGAGVEAEATLLPPGPNADAAHGEDALPSESIPTIDLDAEMRSAVERLKKAGQVGGTAHLEAVRSIRQLVSNYEAPPYDAAVSAGAVPALITALQPPRMDATSLECIFEASWALTNLAVGEPEVVRAITPAAPLLIAHLGGGSGFAVAEQCAWALGNIAGEDVEYRDILIANGAVRPLAQVLVDGTAAAEKEAERGGLRLAESDHPGLAAAATAAWALSNILQGAGARETGEFMGTRDAPEVLVRVMHSAPDSIATDAAWVGAYLTAGPEAHVHRLVSLGIVSPLLARIEDAVGRLVVGSGEPAGTLDASDASAESTENASVQVVTPLLRLLGNVAGAGTPAAIDQIVSEVGTLKAVVICAESRNHRLQREAALVLSNLAGVPGARGVAAIKAAGALPILMSLLKDQPFHVRKEAAFALANVCAGGGGGTGDAEAANYLFGGDIEGVRAMVSLMRSSDIEAATLGLQFTEMLLRLLPSGAEAVEAVDGIDAIEALQFGATTADDVRVAAARLVDAYWGIGPADGGEEDVAVL